MAAFVSGFNGVRLRQSKAANTCGRNGVIRAVATPVQEVSRDANRNPLAERPPFNLEAVKKAIPPHLWEKNLNKSIWYLVKDAVIVFGLAAAAVAINNPLAWLFYYFAQGTMMWALFVVGHDAGHGSFSNSTKLNNIFGHIAHGSILVPFHGWRISHRTHHGNHGHIDNDESWYPVSESYYKEGMDAPSKAVRYELPLVLIAYQIYLFRRTPGKEGSHFDPSCELFKKSERNMILQSTASCLAMLGVLAGVGMKFGFMFVLNTYLIPHLIFCAWLVVVTYLHHTDSSVPWFRDGEWTYLRGALSTLDKDYGIFNKIHHDIGTHVVHHMFPQMPHYNIVEATEHIKPVLGEYYRAPERSGFLPFHLVRDLIKSLKECRFVDDVGSVVFYRNK